MSRTNQSTRGTMMVLAVMFLSVMMATSSLYGGSATIGGSVYGGWNDGSGPVYAPNPLTPPLTDAKVMVQDIHSGAWVAYGAMTGNSWTATVPTPAAPDSAEFVVMFCAPGHDRTSRAFVVRDGDTVIQDAYLPPLVDLATGEPDPAGDLPRANLLAYAFEDWAVNGEDDYPDDPALKGVTFRVYDEHGTVVQTGVSGSSPTLPPGAGPHPDGLYYFTDLEPGEYKIEADPTTVPGWTEGWYHTSSEEGSQMYEVILYPGDPGTEAGAYLIWYGFVKRLGQFGGPWNPNPFNPTIAGSISGVLLDADGTDPLMPPPEPGEDDTIPPDLKCLFGNGRVPDGFAVLFSDGEGLTPHPLATTNADPVTGEYEFVNVPPGRYKIFACDIPIDYVWVPLQVRVPPATNVAGQNILLARFFARARGYVLDGSTDPPTPIPGAKVNFRLDPHNVWKYTTTDADGWYLFDDLEEVETMGFMDVVPPPGYRLMDLATPGETDECLAQKGMRGNRYVMFFSGMNYQVDLYVEPIPATEGDISGITFNDELALGTWTSDGLYTDDEEATIKGVRVELWDATMTTMLDFTTSAEFDRQAVIDQGWIPLLTQVPGDEWGGVFNGPILGHYEFKGLATGDYNVKVIPPDLGHLPSTPAVVPVTIAGGDRHDVDFGLATTVPKAGIIEGGVFDDLWIDNNPLSTFYMEKALLTGTPVVVYDHLGYQLDVMVQPSPLCYETAPPGLCDRPDLGDDVEIDRLVSSGIHLFFGNDPGHPLYNPGYIPINMTYTMGQATAKYEADWSLPPVGFAGLGGANLGNGQILPDNAPVIDNPAPLGQVAARLRVGDAFRIRGRNFGAQRGHATVTLAGSKLTVKRWTDTYIDVEIHKKAMSGSILVANSSGISNAMPIEVRYDRRRASYMAARSMFVDASNSGAQDGSEARPWQTINDALDHLPRKTPRYIFVAPGTYQERIHIKSSSVKIIGAGPHETILDGSGPANLTTQGPNGAGPVVHIGKGGKRGGVRNVVISGFTIMNGTVDDDIGAGIFADYGNSYIKINTNIIIRNGGYYGGGVWLHRSNHNVKIYSNLIAENGNYGGYGGAISVNDEPDEYEEEHGEPEHIWDDDNPGPPPGTYAIYNNLMFHNFSPDYGGAVCLYEIKDKLEIFGNMFVENHAYDHGGAMFFEDCGPVEIHENVFLRNVCMDDGGAISFEDVGDKISTVKIYNNLFAENIADDKGENHARGGALAFDDTFYGSVYNNTFAGNIACGSYYPAGGALDSERNGHEYSDPRSPYYQAPGFSDPQIFNNIFWGNWRMKYDQPVEGGEEEDMDYTWGDNYRWSVDELHVDNPHLQEEWEADNNSDSFTMVNYNDIRGGYSKGVGNINVDPRFVLPSGLNWHLQSWSPVKDKADGKNGPGIDLDHQKRVANRGWIDMGAHEWSRYAPNAMRIPEGILGAVVMPIPGSTSLDTSPPPATFGGGFGRP